MGHRMKRRMKAVIESGVYERDERNLENANTENVEIKKVIDWIKGNQFAHGEWGGMKLEAGSDRTEKDSKDDPNIFYSTTAVQILRALGADVTEEEKRMCEWMERVRDKKGYWINRAGRKSPYGKPKKDITSNIRHTVRGLDYLLRTGRFVDRRDAEVLRKILKKQKEKGNGVGGVPQFPDRSPEVYATAYFINLLITLKDTKGVTLLRKNSEERDTEIKNRINRRLERAIGYILDSKNKKRLWGEDEDDYEAETTGIMFQIGPYLMQTHPDEYREIMYRLGKIKVERKYTRLYLAMTGIELFSKEEQQPLFKILREDKTKFEEIEKVDFVEVLCYGLVQKFKNNIGLLQYYNYLNHAHEFVQPELLSGKDEKDVRAEYIKWCLEQYKEFPKYKKGIEIDSVIKGTTITNKTELWGFCKELFHGYKDYIEKEGWKNFWDKEKHVLEKQVQKDFWSYAIGFLRGHEIVANREKNTGAGLVDFEFGNGYRDNIVVEFKLASNKGLLCDGAVSQIRQYAVGTGTDTAFRIVFVFNDKEKENIGKINAEIQQCRLREPDRFIEVIFIDASKKQVPSKQYQEQKIK